MSVGVAAKRENDIGEPAANQRRHERGKRRSRLWIRFSEQPLRLIYP